MSNDIQDRGGLVGSGAAEKDPRNGSVGENTRGPEIARQTCRSHRTYFATTT
jgi:hypothetical protein